jgi:hypothetical protein
MTPQGNRERSEQLVRSSRDIFLVYRLVCRKYGDCALSFTPRYRMI